MPRQSRIYVTGDTHRTTDIGKLLSPSMTRKKLTKNDFVIIAGDFGALWNGYGSEQDEHVLGMYAKFPWTTLWVDGNHENFDQLKMYPTEEWNGGLVQKMNDSVIHLMRGQIYDIDGLKFFTMGGATSIDKMFRIRDISWWSQEMPTNEEYDIAMRNLQAHDMKVDYVITHCCSRSSLLRTLPSSQYDDELNGWFDYLEKDMGLEYKHWYYGHYHIDKKVDDKHTCLYNKIVRIK
jgi:hypothetical protein